MYFGDPMLTGRQYLSGIVVGGLLGGTINGGIALGNGRSFWSGSLNTSSITTTPMPALGINSQEAKLNTDGMRSQLKSMPDILEEQTFWRINGSDGRNSYINQKNITLSPRQSLHLGNTAGKSPLTVDPSKLINDINRGNFQFTQLNHRGMPIVKFNYPIGNVLQQGTVVNLGSTYYGTVHLNNSGQAHIIPWLFR